MPGFLVFWFGQVVSLLGTNMSGFAITVWAYELTGSATALALVGISFMVPLLVMSPVAGALVDRSNRKFMMAISDLASGIATLGLLVLYSLGELQIWHLYVAAFISGAFQAFQWPAFSAAISTMIPKEQYGRANGLMSLAESGTGIFAPLAAGALLGFIGLGGILLFDVASFAFAILVLLFIRVPQPPTTAAGIEGRGSLLQESVYGFKYILKRPSLLGLQLVFMIGNFIIGIGYTVQAPMILARTGNNELIFGSVNSAGAVGGVIGGLIMSAWGGTKRKVHGVLTGWAVSGLFGMLLFGLGRGAVVWAAASFIGSMLVPWINGSNQAIWMAKVAPDVQGRVFSIRRLIAWITNPLSALLGGTLADYVMEPAARSGGELANLMTPIVGAGPGTGMSMMMVVCGLIVIMIGLGAYSFPVVRNAEAILPDHDIGEAQPAPPAQAEASAEPAS